MSHMKELAVDEQNAIREKERFKHAKAEKRASYKAKKMQRKRMIAHQNRAYMDDKSATKLAEHGGNG